TGQGGLWGDAIEVDCGESSQFATAILLGAPMASRSAAIKIVGLEGSSGYLEVTEDVMEAFGANPVRTFTGYDVANSGYLPADYVVERDASAAVYPIVAAAISRGRVSIPGLSLASKQPDIAIALHLREMGCVVHDEDGVVVDATDVTLEAIDVDLSGSPDGALALAVACLFATGESRLRGLFSLRHKESDRLRAMSEELVRLGGDVSVESEGLIIRPGPLHGATINSHGDHRVAMSLALIGTMVEGVAVGTPSVVNKTWPGFWDQLQSWSAH
ncbi:MAG: 3-phosphoshikimate 1-carboxyvinyltransferase, partial [Acidimicrobiia bacterium]